MSIPFLITVSALQPGGSSASDSLRYQLRIGDTPIGHLASATWADSAGRIHRSERAMIRMKRGEQSIRITERTEWTEDAAGALLSMNLGREGMGPVQWMDRIVRGDSGWERERNRGGATVRDRIPPDALCGPVGVDRFFRRDTTDLAIRILDPEELAGVLFRARRIGDDTLTAGSGRIPCRVYSIVDSSGNRQPSRSVQWRDPDGSLWRESSETYGLLIEREELAEPGRPAFEFDAFSWRRLAVQGTPPDHPPCALEMIPVDESAGPRAGAPVPDEPGQRVNPGPSPGSFRITIERPRPGPTSESDRLRWRENLEHAVFLKPGLIVDSENPAIRTFADGAVVGAASPTEEAFLLERSVHHAIERRDLSTVIGTASQTLNAGRGDCTEHAVLLAACCRARGIPARLVAGLVPVGTQMMFHLWTEIYLNDWCSFDATLGEGAANPCAVALARWRDVGDDLSGFGHSFGELAGRYTFHVRGGQQ